MEAEREQKKIKTEQKKHQLRTLMGREILVKQGRKRAKSKPPIDLIFQ